MCELMERIVAEEVEKANEVQAKTIAEKMYKKKMPVEEIADFVGYCVHRSPRSPRPAELSSRSAEIEQWHRPD